MYKFLYRRIRVRLCKWLYLFLKNVGSLGSVPNISSNHLGILTRITFLHFTIPQSLLCCHFESETRMSFVDGCRVSGERGLTSSFVSPEVSLFFHFTFSLLSDKFESWLIIRGQEQKRYWDARANSDQP